MSGMFLMPLDAFDDSAFIVWPFKRVVLGRAEYSFFHPTLTIGSLRPLYQAVRRQS